MTNVDISLQFRCPACDTTTNKRGQPLVSEWAVATHMAGEMGGGHLHDAWAREYARQADLSKKGWALAKELILPIHEALKTQEHRQLKVPPPIKRSVVDLIQDIELQLHSHIKRRLQERFGTENDSWWVEGIPLTIRQDCAQRREADRARQELFNYTYLIDLKTVLDKNWSLFEPDFTRIRNVFSSKKNFLEQITRLNDVRNRHFHPIRAPKPESKASVDDHDYVSKMAESVAGFCGHATK